MQLIKIFEFTLLTCFLLGLSLWLLCSKDQWTLIATIVNIRNSAETMGAFWYVMVSMFKDRIFFMEEVYLLFQFATACYLCELSVNVAHMIRCLEFYQEPDSKGELRHKLQRRRERLLMHGYLLLTIIKMLLNQYPTLHDVNLVFFTLAMNVTLIFKYVGGLHVIICGLVYGIANTLFMWITWL